MAEKIFRCAVYTRKSTEDGLEKEFNSLDAQYEACAAYALGQKHEGWRYPSAMKKRSFVAPEDLGAIFAVK